ncbi:EamA family transporter RarD [Pseudopelagicola sp. nBUS_19]|uniref:EamA family transporter RarD n=1 Tax=unclassified Pseudopelagicola TaxID=2649563 RepID=UPI003EB81D81
MGHARWAIVSTIGAAIMWGLSPLYYKMLAHVPPIEMLAHRTFWSAVIFVLVIALQGRSGELARVVVPLRQGFLVFTAALLVSFNWFVFIWAIAAGRTTDASMGYFLLPLVSVLLGRLVLNERQSLLQWVAVALATIAVLTLAVVLQVPPWIALSLAVSFGCYGLIKKQLLIGPVISVTAEVLMLCPVALIVLWHFHSIGEGSFGNDAIVSLLLVFSGVLTATPLILYSRGARYLPLATIGILQFINPSLQFLCAVLILAEPLYPVHFVSFPLIWVALAMYTLALWRQERADTKAASASSTFSAT